MAAIRADDKIILRIVVLLPLFNKMMTLLVYYGISCCDNNLHDKSGSFFGFKNHVDGKDSRVRTILGEGPTSKSSINNCCASMTHPFI